MKNEIIGITLVTLGFLGYKLYQPQSKTGGICTEKCEANPQPGELSCKLSSPELQARKETVLASLKNQTLEKRELADGFAYKFSGDDKVLDELVEFVKTERTCCDFFTFNISTSGDKTETWLEIKGIEGAKEFIMNEMDW